MSWFVYALIATVAWGCADLFYKLGNDERDRFSHLKTSIAVGVVMGLHAAYTLLFGGIDYDWMNLLVYLPVSAMYILSMTVGYFGLRYLELSVSSPIQNSSGAVSCILLLIVLGQTMDIPTAASVIAICVGIFLLGVFEKQRENRLVADDEKKYRIGFIAFFMPILYCVIDALGTFFDGYYLDDIETTPLRAVTEDTFENVANTSYELTFFFTAVILAIYVYGIRREKPTINGKPARVAAAVFETGGQFVYVYAMSGNAAVAAPMIASYSIVSVILSRIFLKEKLSLKQYLSIALVMIGIAVLGYLEGIAE